MVSGCSSKPIKEVVVQKETIEVVKATPQQFRLQCNVPELQGDTVKDVLILATKQHNELLLCNMIISERNRWEDEVR